ncbi:hypothetical protein H2200_000525 [Cladophialophora chaetospira]|uniref:Ankyrin repeat protein n=1 Tax=Cladophialophora chaetospira TaxID=386627 RepID=A0AA38XPF3_9EURO|nr:hypothetical protein H2200_000525 [Cladophialophora chaetospira]
MVLHHGVDVHARGAQVDDRDTVYGSALHAAAAGGHKQIVLQLLAYGADPRTARLQEYMKNYVPDEMLTPIAAALKHPRFRPRTDSESLLDVCEVITEAGVNEADLKLVVVECAESGSIDRQSYIVISTGLSPYQNGLGHSRMGGNLFECGAILTRT